MSDRPLISILMPTRKRITWLDRAVSQFIHYTHDKSKIEFVFWIDDDDQDTDNYLKNLGVQLNGHIPMTVLKGPRGRGYLDMHLWVNEMCKVSKGEWLHVANDDCYLLTYGWDQMLLHFVRPNGWHKVSEVELLGGFTNQAISEAFYFLRREVFEIIGHISRHHLNDNYIWKVMKFCESAHYIPIHFYHEPRELCHDDTGMAVLKSHDEPDGMARVHSSELAQWRLEDAAKLIAYLKSRGA